MTGDPGDMIFGTYLMGLCLLDGKLKTKNDLNPNPLFMKLESDWRIFADYMVYKVHTLYFFKLTLKMSMYDAVSFPFP